MTKQKIAVYPGSFDPIHNGHLDILERSKKFFDQVICAVGRNTRKTPLFSLEERLDMLYHTVPKDVEVNYFEGLLVDYINEVRKKKKGYKVIIRGTRLITDYEFEAMIAFNNRKLYPDVETILIPSKQELLHVNSTVIRDVAMMNPNYISTLDVPEYVKQKLKEKCS